MKNTVFSLISVAFFATMMPNAGVAAPNDDEKVFVKSVDQIIKISKELERNLIKGRALYSVNGPTVERWKSLRDKVEAFNELAGDFGYQQIQAELSELTDRYFYNERGTEHIIVTLDDKFRRLIKSVIADFKAFRANPEDFKLNEDDSDDTDSDSDD